MLETLKWSAEVISSTQTTSRVKFNYHPSAEETLDAVSIAFDSYLSTDPITSFKTIQADDEYPMAFDERKQCWSFETELAHTTRMTFSFSAVNSQDNQLQDVTDPNTGVLLEGAIALPQAPKQIWLEPNNRAEKGHVEYFIYYNGELRRARSDQKANEHERRVAVYIPANASMVEAHQLDLQVMLDGFDYFDWMALPTQLDNLIHSKLIASRIVAFIEPQNKDRMREYICNPELAKTLAEEIVPQLQQRFRQINPKAENTTLVGESLSGLQSAYTALNYPHVFGNVISQSGAFMWTPTNRNGTSTVASEQDGVYWFIDNFIKPLRTVPVRFYLEAGWKECSSSDSSLSILESNKILFDALRAKSASVYFKPYDGGHSYIHWRGNIANAMKRMDQLRRPASNEQPKSPLCWRYNRQSPTHVACPKREDSPQLPVPRQWNMNNS